MLVSWFSRPEFDLFDVCSSVTARYALQKGVVPMRHRSIVDERQLMSNDDVSTRMHALKTGTPAVGALALGAFALGALAIGALAIGRPVIGRSRIRRLEIDELVVARLHVRESLAAPNTPTADNTELKKTAKWALQSAHNGGSDDQQTLRYSRWARPRSAAQLSARGPRPKEWANPFDSRGCARSGWQAILGGAARLHAVGTQRHRKWHCITEKRTAQRGIRYAFACRRGKAGDSEVLSRPVQAHRAAVFPGTLGLSERSFSTTGPRLPGLRADTPIMNLAGWPSEGKAFKNRDSGNVRG